MNGHITIGVDNGASGSVGIITPWSVSFAPVPTQDYIHYGKRGTIGKRLDRRALQALLLEGIGWTGPSWVGTNNVRVYIERPFSGKFINAVVPAHRFFEATIITLEDLFEPGKALGYEVVDSQTWQKPLLGNVTGSANLKKASRLRGIQLYPQLTEAIRKQGDADGLLIAHHFHYGQAHAANPTPTA